MLSRRGFLARLVAAPVVALTVLRAPVKQHWIDDLISFKPEETGISIRDIQQFEAASGSINRFDVLYGFANLTPEFVVRITAEEALPWWNPRRWL